MTFVLLALTLSVAPAAAQDDVSAVLAGVEGRYQSVESLRAEFTQVKAHDLYGETRQEGRVVFKRPSMMRWEFTTAPQVQFVTDGVYMWAYTVGDSQATRYSATAGAAPESQLLQSLDRLDELYAVSLQEPPADGLVTLRLAPKEGQAARFRSLDLVLQTEDWGVRSVRIDDGFGTVTTLEFTAVEVNPTLAHDAFTFTPPEGVTVVEL